MPFLPGKSAPPVSITYCAEYECDTEEWMGNRKEGVAEVQDEPKVVSAEALVGEEERNRDKSRPIWSVTKMGTLVLTGS